MTIPHILKLSVLKYYQKLCKKTKDSLLSLCVFVLRFMIDNFHWR